MAACKSCEVVYINGIKCHETGCPEAWKDEVRECKWCGQDFKPNYRTQLYCDEYCANDYLGSIIG